MIELILNSFRNNKQHYYKSFSLMVFSKAHGDWYGLMTSKKFVCPRDILANVLGFYCLKKFFFCFLQKELGFISSTSWSQEALWVEILSMNSPSTVQGMLTCRLKAAQVYLKDFRDKFLSRKVIREFFKRQKSITFCSYINAHGARLFIW